METLHRQYSTNTTGRDARKVRKERRIEVVKAPKGSTGLADGSFKNPKI